MKFSRYLQDTQTPEWKKAYIDYRGLKLQLQIIRSKSPPLVDASSPHRDKTVVHLIPNNEEKCSGSQEPSHRASTTSAGLTCLWVSKTDSTVNGIVDSSNEGALSAKRTSRQGKRTSASFSLTVSMLPSRATSTTLNTLSQETPLPSMAYPPIPAPFRHSEYYKSLSLRAALSTLPAIHIDFFDMLDAELGRVATFYSEREKEMQERDELLRKQLKELGMHREVFHKSSAHWKARSWSKRPYLSIIPILTLIYWLVPLNAKLGKRLQMGGKSVNPYGYQHAKRRLRTAVIEHYRGLEVLNKYRILNLAGFRNALEKYEKITGIHVLDAYMKEKVEPSSFAPGAMVGAMLKATEQHFATRFERGDQKKAKYRLRAGRSSKAYYFSIFRSGLWLGLALPAVAAGSYLSFQEHTRGSLPSWNILLFIYSVFVVPVLLVLLIGLNILVWARKKISYAFIFELNPRSRLHHYEYFELPSLLLCTLAYAFWFSLAQIGPSMLWPLIWLALALAIIFNPVHGFMRGRARWWTIKNIVKLGASGILEVGFTDVWLGDQLCSLVYSLSNMYFVGCFYSHFAKGALTNDSNMQEAWETCSVVQNWRWYYLLALLPFAMRFMQSLRRYLDSGHPIQLINAGKYAMAMVYYLCYYYWRHQNAPLSGESYILWCFTATINSIYGCTWDFLMDWSVCKLHTRYPLLRRELVYKSQVPCYYFALVSNLCIRFSWLMYIYLGGLNITLFTFINAVLEMLRRVQWNFYRLENQHLGNMSQYQVTREVPLPYRFDVHSNEEGRMACQSAPVENRRISVGGPHERLRR